MGAGLTGLIGLNSSGKTTALEALRKLFGSNAERQFVKGDFHIGVGEEDAHDTEKQISIEAIIKFDDHTDGKDEAIPHFFNHMVVEEEKGEPYLRIRLESTWWDSKIKPEGDIEIDLFFIKVPERQPEDVDTKHKFPKHLKSLIEVFYIPAIRRPSEQIRYASGTILYRILKKIKWDEGFTDEFQTHIENISKLFKSQVDVGIVETSIKTFWKKFHQDKRYRETDLNFGDSDFESILKKLEIAFTPTGTKRPYKVDDLGEGFRSLFYLTLVCSLLDVEEKLAEKEREEDDKEIGPSRPLLTLLAIEEPENHIAPQLLGRVINVLNEIVKKDRTQAVVSSHSPAIVKRLDPESICHFRITEDYQTEVNTIVLPSAMDEAYKYVKQAVQNYPEIYFARLVLIGEGESEEVLFNRLMGVKKINFDNNVITFAPLGHRFVNHIWKLLDALHIDYVTLLDLDAERGGGGYGRIKYVVDQLLLLGVPKSKLLEIKGGKIIEAEELLEWELLDDADMNNLMAWVRMLERYNVFFSAPLDLDFLMLKQFPEAYKKIVPKRGGPRIPDKDESPEDFKEKVEKSVQATLKSAEATGNCYSEDDKELMIWYDYHFLGRGKPSTHIQALAEINDENLLENGPEVFNKVFDTISKRMKIEDDEKG